MKESVKIIQQANNRTMAANSRISEVYVQAKYEKYKQLQKSIRLLQKRNSTQISGLSPPWREKIHSLSLYSNNLLYLDDRLFIPKDLRKSMLTAIHIGHAGRDAMLTASKCVVVQNLYGDR